MELQGNMPLIAFESEWSHKHARTELRAVCGKYVFPKPFAAQWTIIAEKKGKKLGLQLVNEGQARSSIPAKDDSGGEGRSTNRVRFHCCRSKAQQHVGGSDLGSHPVLLELTQYTVPPVPLANN